MGIISKATHRGSHALLLRAGARRESMRDTPIIIPA